MSHRHGPRPVKLLILAVIVCLAVASGVLSYLDGRYGPVQGSNFSGPLSKRGLVFSKDWSSYRLASTPGVTATFIAGLDNGGAHSVEITSIEPSSMVSDVRWSVYRAVNGGSISGVSTPWRSFPATLPAHDTIRLLLTVRQPPVCAAYRPRGGRVIFDGSLLVHWKSLLSTHATSAKVLLSPIAVC